MRIGLYFDEDTVRHALVAALLQRGVDVRTALDADMIQATDDQQLAFAADEGRTIYTFNMQDFCRLHAEWLAAGRSHTGIVVARQQQYSVGEQMRRLLRLLAAKTADDMHNHLEFLSDWEPGAGS
ncbi:MAG: DUF5615 family PIN-like protein [Thermoguttaceae bacterium]|nr:DUF5615 family PIN-like protein [Thermoguttaceae bacterium]